MPTDNGAASTPKMVNLTIEGRAVSVPEGTSILEAAKTAAALMGMNNIYYRFLHLTSNSKYATIPARLRMNGIRTHGIDHNDFELWCTAVSAINGCGACVESHQKALVDRNVSEETILAAVRIASVIHGLAGVLDAEALPVAETDSRLQSQGAFSE